MATALSAQSRIFTETITSKLLGVEKHYTVYLPSGYDLSEKKYPVLYLLHGASDTHEAWKKQGDARRIIDELVNEGMLGKLIVIMPDASGEGENHTGKNMGYFNLPDWPYEDFFFEEFIPTIEKRYRIHADKRHRAIAGLSMGGGGSAHYALTHPELFGSACLFSGLLDAFPSPRGYQTEFIESVAANSPVKRLRAMSDEEIKAVRSVRWYVDCGDDDFLWQSNVDFYAVMRERRIPLQYRMRDGAHNWHYWKVSLRSALLFISTEFNRSK